MSLPDALLHDVFRSSGMNRGRAEWLEADGLGGFASGTVSGLRTRRYHALLLAAMTPPTARVVLVNGFDAWVTTAAGRFAISSQAYPGGIVHPDGSSRVMEFSDDPWPRWLFRLDDGTQVVQELFVPKGSATVALSWRLKEPRSGPAMLTVRPFFSGRDYHSMHHENPAFGFEPRREGGRLVWNLYPGLPAVVSSSNGAYAHEPVWYRDFFYAAERERGLDSLEDLASPGTFSWNLADAEACWILQASHETAQGGGAPASIKTLRAAERRRRSRLATRLDRAADTFLVARGDGQTIVAGYPWFTDWGRDTFIALRGLCLATGRLKEARAILMEWASAVSEGMLPNFFPDGKAAPEYNSVDASLWYVVAVGDFIKSVEAAGRKAAAKDRAVLRDAVEAILLCYSRGTRFGIRMDDDGLLAAGEPGVQLTWMDAKVGDWVVTPRIGKPVEIQALWVNALAVGASLDGPMSRRWDEQRRRALESFGTRFWNPMEGCLYDVIDVDHRRGTVDVSFRPNQILAVGGLPVPLVVGPRARRVVDAVEDRLLTPLGLRSLAPGEPGYAGRYEGGPRERDVRYHQGTVWPWLIASFADAWVRVREGSDVVRHRGRDLFLAPLLAHLDDAGLGSVSEIADGDAPHTPRGCPFQAWSVGEVIRLDREILRLRETR